MGKKTLTIILSLFVVSSIGYMIYSESKHVQEVKSKTEQSEATSDAQDQKKNITVYYFHSNFRCYSCKRIEELTKRSVQKHFSTELHNGMLVFKTINVDNNDNKHFIRDFELFTKSVVVTNNRKDQKYAWKRLDNVWDFLKNEDAFDQYIYDEIQQFLIKES